MPNNETIATMTNIADSGQGGFVADWAQMVVNAFYEQGVSQTYLQSDAAQYIIAKGVTDLIEDGEFSKTTLSLIATLRANHPHSEDD